MSDASKKDLRAEGLAQLNKYRNKRQKKGTPSAQSQSSGEKKETKKLEVPLQNTPVITQEPATKSEAPPSPRVASTPNSTPPSILSSSVTAKATPVSSPKVTTSSIPVKATNSPQTTREAIQIQPSSSEAAQKVKMLQQTNALLGSQNQTLTNQVQNYEHRIRQLEADQQALSITLKQTETSKKEALEATKALKQKHILELAEYKEKDKEVAFLKESLAQLQSKHDDEVRLRQSNQTAHEEELMPLRGQIKLLELEKKQAEREKIGAEYQLKEANQTNSQLQAKIAEIEKLRASLEEQLAQSTSQLNHILDTQGPTEREIRAKELEIERMKVNHASDIARLTAYCKQLELENASLSERCRDLSAKTEHGDALLAEATEKIRAEYKDMAINYGQQANIIEKLMSQKRLIMQQLTREVERNGTLVKENLEAKQTITLQQQILLQYSTQEDKAVMTRDISLSAPGAPRVTVPYSPASTPKKEHRNALRVPEYEERRAENQEMEMVRYNNGAALQLPPMDLTQIKSQLPPPQKGWLASIPLFGRLWTPKTPVQQNLVVI
eukprot:TRINITY_DN6508_c0_g1_i1.p2 TRINITY_DN6508_c0_g1~~TRINITY_DN6508_c0_g1_i1.p2  ORF type:complete len:555 (-),score=147.55 TRINITY_DN6508_c0_g1_i1:21-1685(-)